VRARSGLAGIAVGLVVGVGVLGGAWMRERDAAASRPHSSPGKPLIGAPAPYSAGPGAPSQASRPDPDPFALDGAATSAAAVPDAALDVARLRARLLTLPLPDLDPRLLRDSFGDPRSGRAHEALDIPAPRGTRVVAVEDGTVAKLFDSARGGLTVYQFDPSSTYCYYYAHLDAYAPGLREGQALRRGDLVGFVGTTGNAPPQTPHLHFAIFRLGTPARWWEGTPINPYVIWVKPG